MSAATSELNLLTEDDNQAPVGGDAVPDGGYGWVCVVCCLSINAFTWGVVASYGVFLDHYINYNLFPGSTQIGFAFIGGLNFGAAMLTAPTVTIMTRRFDIHPPMYLGIALQTLGFIFASLSTKILGLVLTQGFLVGLGVGFTYLPMIGILSQWFSRHRSLANGFSAAGAGVGGLVFSFAVRAMLTRLSLAWTLRVIGLASGIANIVAATLLRSRNHVIRPNQKWLDINLLRRYDVWLLLVWAFLSVLGYIVLQFTLSDFAHSIGLSDGQSATVTALLSLGTALGRPVTGIISDRFGRIEMATLLTFMSAILVFAFWIPTVNYSAAAAFATLVGLIYGVFWVTIAPVCAEVVGLVELPSALSIVWLVICLPTTFSEVIALQIRRPGTAWEFLYPQVYAGTAYLLASLASLELWRVHRRRLDSLDSADLPPSIPLESRPPSLPMLELPAALLIPALQPAVLRQRSPTVTPP